jgi:hypothetical protein
LVVAVVPDGDDDDGHVVCHGYAPVAVVADVYSALVVDLCLVQRMVIWTLALESAESFDAVSTLQARFVK